ncbi:hypothetical protein ACPPVO_07835 [Dactylosporangium sp. McL0621]|uniref:hypothetical protein n=1 Tax=Dactylosporangium sp. McL0621 TaxID=3415678 RepID=UPI003CEEE1E9
MASTDNPSQSASDDGRSATSQDPAAETAPPEGASAAETGAATTDDLAPDTTRNNVAAESTPATEETATGRTEDAGTAEAEDAATERTVAMAAADTPETNAAATTGTPTGSQAPGSFTPVDDVLTGALSADGMHNDAEAPVRSRRRLALVLGTAAVIVAVVAAGAAYAVKQRWDKPTGALPEDRLPASVAAFARVNLTPGLGQRVKFEELLRRASGAPAQVDGLERELFEGLRTPITYADVAPWFDDRIGVAMWAAPAHPDRAVTLVVASATDDKKARTSLETLQRKRGTDRIGFVVEDGYVLVAVGELDAQDAAAAAADEAKRAPLAKDAAFRSAIGTLPGDQPVIGWADLPRATKLEPDLSEAFLGELPGAEVLGQYGGPVPSAASGPPASPSAGAGRPALDLSGVAVVGLQAADDALEATVRLIGVDGLPLGTDAGRTDVVNALGALSGDASAAGVLAGPIGDPAKLLGPDAGALLLGLFGTVMPGAVPIMIDGSPPNRVISDGELEQYLREHPEIFGELPPGELESIEIGGLEGLQPLPNLGKLTERLSSGVGAAQAVSFTVAGKADEQTQAEPLLLDLRMADAGAAARMRDEVATDLTKISKVTCEQHEDHVVLRSAAYTGGTSRLADNPLFQRAMAGAVASPVAAVYLAGSSVGDPFRAVGVTAGRAGADTVLHARLVLA